ncbi:hypothetical protein L208DRAFT_1479145, partial [Tricholoma matsutake]
FFFPLPEYPCDTVQCKIKLKDANRTITTQNYSCPQKYCEAWSTSIQKHLEARHIHPSSSEHVCPPFLMPKADNTVLPCWVNDY